VETRCRAWAARLRCWWRRTARHRWTRMAARRGAEESSRNGGRCLHLRQATTSLGMTEVTERPLRVTPKLVRQTIDEMTGT
jgi:hypothetical protein